MMFISPNGTMWGMDPMLEHMQCLPLSGLLFTNFSFSGVMLILINGVCNTAAVVGLWRGRRWGVLCGGASGVMLLCWLGVQWMIFAVNPLTTLYTVLGVLQVLLAGYIFKQTLR